MSWSSLDSLSKSIILNFVADMCTPSTLYRSIIKSGYHIVCRESVFEDFIDRGFNYLIYLVRRNIGDILDSRSM